MLLDVITELERREVLYALIDYAIETRLRERPGMRMKKGLVHDVLARATELELSPNLRSLFNRRLKLKGYDSGIRQGYQYFFDVEEVPRG